MRIVRLFCKLKQTSYLLLFECTFKFCDCSIFHLVDISQPLPLPLPIASLPSLSPSSSFPPSPFLPSHFQACTWSQSPVTTSQCLDLPLDSEWWSATMHQLPSPALNLSVLALFQLFFEQTNKCFTLSHIILISPTSQLQHLTASPFLLSHHHLSYSLILSCLISSPPHYLLTILIHFHLHFHTASSDPGGSATSSGSCSASLRHRPGSQRRQNQSHFRIHY